MNSPADPRFFIEFEPGESAEDTASARITISNHIESMRIPVQHWDRTAYRARWLTACHDFLKGQAGVFPVDIHGARMRRCFVWVAFPDADIARIQHILLRRRFLQPLKPDSLHRFVPPHRTRSSTPNTSISEWQVPRDAIEDFAERLMQESRRGTHEGDTR